MGIFHAKVHVFHSTHRVSFVALMFMFFQFIYEFCFLARSAQCVHGCLSSLDHQDLNDMKAQNRRKQARKREQAQGHLGGTLFRCAMSMSFYSS